ncbi:uncharacterized protein DSM5745_03525 [Aspergillus mulundensis]|uniref:Uncharacterized protein n=1 Tax=Aspergillus mulundensis TaxID=1810919 RepID=A0A3D8SKQ1_9EURO|nr:hypothetical protein DSM5745_03525 [Aspergillus mulundensis]RDW86883.1 hypothetical protein DSM5745_03525 [Aspergillus mulundensis]
MPRTRSQPESPGGFVSLDDTKRATRRTTRSKSAASRAASQEPITEQPTEPVTQAPTRPKAQARTTKKTTTKKAKSTTSTTTKRATRSTSRKAAQDAAEQAQDSVIQNDHDIARTDNEETVEALTEKPESVPSTSDSALMEPKNSEREYNKSPTSLQAFAVPSLPPSPVNSPSSFFVSKPKEPQESKDHQEGQYSEDEPEFEDVPVDHDHSNKDILNMQSEPTPQNFESFQQLAESEVPPSLNADALNSDYIPTLPGTNDDFIQWGNSNLDLDEALANFNLEISDECNAEINLLLANHKTAQESTKNQAVVDTMEQAVAACQGQDADQAIATQVVSSTVEQPITALSNYALPNTTNVAEAAAPTPAQTLGIITSASEELAVAVTIPLPPDNDVDASEQLAIADLAPSSLSGTFATQAALDTSKETVNLAATPFAATVSNPEAAEEPTEDLVVPSASEELYAVAPITVELKDIKEPDNKVAVCDETASLLVSTVDSDEKAAVEDPIDGLIKALANISLSQEVMRSASLEATAFFTESHKAPANISLSKEVMRFAPLEATAFSTESITVRQPAPAGTRLLASIYDDIPPSVPDMPTLLAFMRRQVPKPTLFGGPIPYSPSTIFDDRHPPPTVDTIKDQKTVEEHFAPLVLEEEPRLMSAPPRRPSKVRSNDQPTSQAPRRQGSRAWHATPLSPIAEEQDLNRHVSPAVLAKEAIPAQAIPTQSVPVEHTTTSTVGKATPVKPLEPSSTSSAPEISVPTSSSARPRVPLSSTGFSPSIIPVNGSLEGPNNTASSSKMKNLSEDKTLAEEKAIKRTPKTPKVPGNTMTPSSSKVSGDNPRNTDTSACISSQLNQKKPKTKKKLTKTKVNRKRAHTEDIPDDNAEPVTPYANKRRNLGPPGSTPFARRSTRLTPLRRLPHKVSWSERKLRREAERQGRIQKTIFRLPEFVAQTEADRRASEAAALTSTLTTEPLKANFDFSLEPAQTDDQTAPEESAAAQETPAKEPSTPEPARSSWNLSGLINSVPRSLTRLLPRFGRTRSTSEAPAIQEPASERIQRTQPAETSPDDAATEQNSQAHRRLSEQPPAKRARTLSYSLFPAPIDRSRYLGDIPPKPLATVPVTAPASDSAPRPAEKATPQSTELHTSSTPIERGRDSTPQTSNATTRSKHKRKRSPSPDVIPNPEGSSYGMDIKYFEISDDSEDEVEPSPPPTEPRNRGKTSLRSIAQSERPASKKVRFDASPEDTPSKRRARATDPYRGRHFIGMGGPQTSSAPPTPTPESSVADPRQRDGFIPNTSGTYQLDYDAFSDDSDTEDETVSSPSHPTPSVVRTPSSTQPDTSAPSPAPPSAARPAQPPSTPTTKFDEEALARARSQAEKYKPKTPSGLRTASRYSSPLTAITPDLTPASTPAPALPAGKPTEEFGDDQFAKDAQWLYDICPTGDLSKLVWPEKKPFGEDFDISDEARRIANEIWDSTEVDVAMPIFEREFAEFKKTLV